jgi:glycosyltransferase involved in cell wall biosynthesis
MKVTFVLPGIGLSGGSRVVFEYSNRLAARGHDVTVVYPLLPISIKYHLTRKELKNNLGALKALGRGKEVKWFDLSARVIRVPLLEPWAMRIVGPSFPDADAVVATSWETAYAVDALQPRKGKKFYFIQHYEIWGCWDDEACWDAAERLEPDPSRLCLAMADVVPADPGLRSNKALVDRTYRLPMRKIVISSWLKELVEKKFGERASGPVINGINGSVFYPEPPAGEKNKLRILMPYRPYKNKGTEDGLRALGIVRQKHPDVECVLFGEKSPAGLPPWAIFHKNPTDDELRRLYSSADVFISPSWVEGFQLPSMEAAACGCAVVATNVGAVPDYGINGRTLLAPPPRRPELLAGSIIELLDDPERRKAIAAQGMAHVSQFTWDKATDTLESILEGRVA